MGFIKNLFTFKEIKKLESDYAIGYYKKLDDKALLYKGEIVVPNISDVSKNLKTKLDSSSSKLFFAKKTGGGYSVLDDKGEVLYPSIKSAAKNKTIKKETFVVDEEKKIEVNQYLIQTGEGKVLIIPQTGFVSDDCSEIEDMDQNGIRKVVNTNNEKYYINSFGEQISPKFWSEYDAGEYKIFYVADSKGTDLDYIYEFIEERGDFVKQSYGYPYIYYSNGRFFAKDNNNGKYMIDELGHKISDYLSGYNVLKNGIVIARLANKAYESVVYDEENNEIYRLNEPSVDEVAGVVSGVDCNDREGRCYMFGLNKRRAFLVNEDCAELMIKILKNAKPAEVYTARLLQNISDEDLEQTISCYEWIIKDNLKHDPGNKKLEYLAGHARELFLDELRMAVHFSMSRTQRMMDSLKDERDKHSESLEKQRRKSKVIEEMLGEEE